MPLACSKCGAALIGSGKFCASCGTPAPSLASTLQSPTRPLPTKTAPPPPVAPNPPQPSAPPPARSSGYGPPPPASPAAYNQLPQTAPQGWNPQRPSSAPQEPQYAAAQGNAYGPPQPTTGYPPPSYATGARVLVQWADGNRYPGMVQQVAPGQCLIVFPDGQQRWVENQYLSMSP